MGNTNFPKKIPDEEKLIVILAVAAVIPCLVGIVFIIVLFVNLTALGSVETCVRILLKALYICNLNHSKVEPMT